MNEIIRWYNANRKKIWGVIIAVLSIIILIQVLNSIAHNQKNTPNKVSRETKEELTNSIVMDNDESTVSGEKLSQSQKNMLKTLDEFADYCNTGNVDKAYGLLSDDCKNEMYPTKEAFETGYYNQIFKGKKNILAENWVENIYKVKYKEDALSTGIYDEGAIQDYITIVKDKDGNTKLNINGYIGKENIDVTEQKDDLKIKVLETDVYMDFQTYTFEITNNSDKTVLLNDPNIDDTMYLEDKSGVKYQAYTHEISSSELKITSKETKKLTIKYYSKYGSNKTIKNILFARIILDYGAYSNYQNIGYYNNYGAIQIKL